LSVPVRYGNVNNRMSEFKFACPVCGQHITADASSSGTLLDCPTCFRRIVVPQAPADSGTKLILSAAQPAPDRPRSSSETDLGPLRRSRPGLPIAGGALLLLLALGAAAAFTFRHELGSMWRGKKAQLLGGKPAPAPAVETPAPKKRVKWTLELQNARIPEQPASGSIRGRPFSCDQAIVSGGGLFLRQGEGWPPELAVALVVPAEQAGQFTGRTVEVLPSESVRQPLAILRWKDGQNREQKMEFTNGYALRLTLDEPAGGRISGKLFLALPDDAKSVVAGTFDAEIKSPRKKK
jgi:hypothetical protein